jgi:hypothetical protein
MKINKLKINLIYEVNTQKEFVTRNATIHGVRKSRVKTVHSEHVHFHGYERILITNNQGRKYNRIFLSRYFFFTYGHTELCCFPYFTFLYVWPPPGSNYFCSLVRDCYIIYTAYFSPERE